MKKNWSIQTEQKWTKQNSILDIEKLKPLKLLIKNSIARLNISIVSAAVLDSYKTSLQNIEKKLEAFEENVTDILIDLEDDDPRKDDLEAKWVKLSNEVKRNEDEINN